MKSFLVRTIEDHTLLGVFCADSPEAIEAIIAPMIDPADCEYLVLKANEGLFVEAQFVHVPSELPNTTERVYLTNTPEDYLDLCTEVETSKKSNILGNDSRLSALCGPGGPLKEAFDEALEEALDEQIPPVLEPTEALAERLNIAEQGAWRPVVRGVEQRISQAIPPHSSTPIFVLSGGSARAH